MWIQERVRDLAETVLGGVGYTGIYQKLPDRNNIVLMYHSVGGAGHASIQPSTFESHIKWLSNTYDIVDLPDVLVSGENKKVALTFDDGYVSFYDCVYPILKKYSIPATVFVIGKTLQEPDSHGNEECMAVDQLTDLKESPLVTIGSHTMTHPHLSKISDISDIEYEINGGTEYIESEVGIDIQRFCYPHNDWSEDARDVVSKTHDIAVNGGEVYIPKQVDIYRIPRIDAAKSLPVLKFRSSDFHTELRTYIDGYSELHVGIGNQDE
jgi:peptidoglycan/xylan/chitin deacetylase (PgdA/CDA1 family)